ncbi:hypothetical protein [Streptomyces sp. NPDC088730]|uniref:hypothetical protein n=1 Tax=Streptomyces sp. NPDC088730 TaxID=3365877 RepID=UPI0038061A1A
MANVTGLLPSTGELSEIAEKLDRIARLIELDATEELSETDLLAGVLVLRCLRDKLQEDERRVISAARRRKITWSRLAVAMELGSRQAAERRYLQLRTDLDELAGRRLTQQNRIEFARDQRGRRAERAWATNHATEIRALALRLLQLPDLQGRADRSLSVQKSHVFEVRSAEHAGQPLPDGPVPAVWPVRLREAFEADAALQAASKENDVPLPAARLKATVVADAIHQLSGLLATAANPANIELRDQEDLGHAIAELYTKEGAPALP